MTTPAHVTWLKDTGQTITTAPGLTAAKVKIGNSFPTAEHAVAMCEDGFGYHLAMILASIADLAEPVSEELREAVAAVQRQVKNGLSGDAANAFYEAGFADRVVAQDLASAFTSVGDRSAVKTLCRKETDAVVGVLKQFPDYFMSVAKELAGL